MKTSIWQNLFAENFTTENRQDVEDKAGHGTFIGGLLGAQNNNHIGIKGLTPNVGLLSFKCFDETLETDIETVITCIERAIDLKVDVLNLSFTTALYSEELEAVLNKAMKQNIIVVAPSGNDLSGKKYYPAAFEGVISVNAVSVEPVSLKVSPAMLSNANNTVTLSAPGDRILSLSHVDRTDYKQRDGTSYATAYVSAAAIIAKQLMSDIDSLTFESLLKKSATDYGEKGYDAVYGHGLLNIEGMIKEVKKLDLYEFH